MKHMQSSLYCTEKGRYESTLYVMLPRKSYIKANVRLVQLNHVHASKHREKY